MLTRIVCGSVLILVTAPALSAQSPPAQAPALRLPVPVIEAVQQVEHVKILHDSGNYKVPACSPTLFNVLTGACTQPYRIPGVTPLRPAQRLRSTIHMEESKFTPKGSDRFVLKRVRPEYPARAKVEGFDTVVNAEVWIEGGKLKGAAVEVSKKVKEKGYTQDFYDEVARALRSWQFYEGTTMHFKVRFEFDAD